MFTYQGAYIGWISVVVKVAVLVKAVAAYVPSGKRKVPVAFLGYEGVRHGRWALVVGCL